MLKNYFFITLRNLRKYKGYSFINVFGLAVGITCVLIISLIIKNEIGYDDFHKNSDKIHRLYFEIKEGQNVTNSACVMIPLLPEAKNNIPEIKEAVRISYRSVLVSAGEKKFYENTIYADKGFFNIFSFNLKSGNKNNVLTEPYSVVISETYAKKYFNGINPVGKTIVFNGEENYIITGVMQDIPYNSHLQGDIFVSFSSYNKSICPNLDEWDNFSNDYAYILTNHNQDVKLLENKLNEIIKKNTDEFFSQDYKIKTQKLSDIHFSNINYDNAKTAPKIMLYVLGAIAIIILVIACINFVNLSTARSVRRFKEVGIRKTAGADRIGLLVQFMTESFFITALSFLLAIILTILLMPQVNDLLKQQLSAEMIVDKWFIGGMFILLLLTSGLSGIYPAFILASARPAIVLKNFIEKRKSKSRLRQSLVTIQIAVSLILITGTLTIYSQLQFLLKKDLGFKSKNIMVLCINDEKIRENGQSLKTALLQNNAIQSATFSGGTPGSNTSRTSNATPEGGTEKDEIKVQIIGVDYDFLETYNIKMKSGRFFSKDFSTDTSDVYIINETAQKVLGWQNINDKKITIGGGGDDADFRKIAGVISDFNYSSLRDKIVPTIFYLVPEGNRFLSVRLNENNLSSTVSFIENTLNKFSPAYLPEYYYIKDSFAKYCRAEVMMSQLLSVFSVLAIFISSIGILGLVAFTTEQKSKEIGIRKVLGASVGTLILNILKEFLYAVTIALVLAGPLAYYILDKWLQDYAYRIDLGIGIFVLSGIITAVIALGTVSLQTLKAANANPINSLKYE